MFVVIFFKVILVLRVIYRQTGSFHLRVDPFFFPVWAKKGFTA
jgi:hypothetical protein